MLKSSATHFLPRSEMSTLDEMARPTHNRVANKLSAADSETAKAASTAVKVSALSSRLEPRAGQFSNRDHPNLQSPISPGLCGRILYWLACLITLSLVAVAVLRVTWHDGVHFLTWLNAFTRYVYLPAYACLAWAIWKRRWILVAANLAVVCFHIALLAPDFMRDRRFDLAANSAAADAPNAPTVRIFFANVRALNTEHQPLLDEIKAANPDVIVLVEFSYPWYAAYLHSPFFAAYPYGGGMKSEGWDTVNVFSRIPLKSNMRDWEGGRSLQTFEIPIGSETLHIIGLHAPRPMDIHGGSYESFWSRAASTILSEKGPLVVVGDFNATQYSKVYEQLTENRLRSAHQDRGRGYVTTWPNGQYGVPSLIRIDQALLSPEVECLNIKEGEGRGSDHKPLIVDVKIRSDR
jgi:endonuclease/exonuclease/phosphatase (EEP) superfamily protein YafD